MVAVREGVFLLVRVGVREREKRSDAVGRGESHFYIGGWVGGGGELSHC